VDVSKETGRLDGYLHGMHFISCGAHHEITCQAVQLTGSIVLKWFTARRGFHH